MKVNRFETGRGKRVKATELVMPPEPQPVFKREEFFTPEEWERIDVVLAEAALEPAGGSENQAIWVELMLDTALALLILDSEKIERLRKNVKLKEKFLSWYNIVYEDGVTDKQVLIANWLYPELDSDMATWLKQEYRDEVTQPGGLAAFFSLMALVEPELFNPDNPDNLDLDHAALAKVWKLDDIVEKTKVALFKSRFLDKESLLSEAARVRAELLPQPKQSTDILGDLVDRLTRAAFLRAALAERVEIKDGKFVIHDANPSLGNKSELPERQHI